MVNESLLLNCHSCEGRKHGVFCNLSTSGLNTLNTNKTNTIVKKGQRLFSEGELSKGLYCLHSGHIKVSKLCPMGKETILRLCSSGEVLGHRSLFSDSPYQATATAIEDSSVCFVSKSIVIKLIQENPSLAFDIMSEISHQMGAAEQKIASLSCKNQKERFAELLLLLKKTHGEKVEDKFKLNIKLSRVEMGAMIGAASENIIRLITEFKKEGLLLESNKTIYLIDILKIEKIARLI